MPQNFSRSRTRPFTEYSYSYNDTTGEVTRVVKTLLGNQVWVSSRTFTGSRVANYRAFRSANGYLPTLGCSDTVFECRGNEVNQNYLDSKGRLAKERVLASAIRSVPPGTTFPTSLSNEAWSKLRRRVLDQDFNAPVFLAEAGKTVGMIATKAKSLALAYSTFRKGNLRATAKHLGLTSGTSHNTWLEYKYGWMPLLSDIHGAAKSLAELKFKRDQSTIRASAKSTKNVNKVGDPFFSGSIDFHAKAWVTVRVKSPNTTLANRIGLLNPVSIAWELIPFSFVADWFVNIGDCIAESTAFAGVTILTGGSSTCVSYRGSWTQVNPLPYKQPLTSSGLSRRYVRTAGVQTMPRLRVKSSPLSVAKVTTAAALLLQAVSFDSGHPARSKPKKVKSKYFFPETYQHL